MAGLLATTPAAVNSAVPVFVRSPVAYTAGGWRHPGLRRSALNFRWRGACTDMRNIFRFTQVSLDGHAAGPQDDLNWTEVADDDLDELMAEQLRSIDATRRGPPS